MKKFAKYLTLVCALLTLAVAAFGFAACGESGDPNAYTVYLKDEAGKAYTDAQIQVCYVEENGELGVCESTRFTVDTNGKAVIPVRKDPNDESKNVQEVEIHLWTLGTPSEELENYVKMRVKLGGIVTVTVTVA